MNPRPAATVIVLRDAQPTPQLYLVKRHSKSGFFANAHVYPGGGVEAADLALGQRFGLDAAPLAERMGCGEDEALAALVAAAREAFEEAGLLLAVDAAGQPIQDHPELTRLRAALNARELGFGEVLVRLDAQLDLGDMGYIAHWITPEAEPRRFDTRFFVAALPSGQQLVPDAREVVDGAWMSAQAALSAYYAGQIELAPPTVMTLAQLEARGALDAILAWAQAHTSAPLLPEFVQVNDRPTIILPGDPLFTRGDATDTALPATRLTLIEGRWRLG
jgi:8-oxo-dGTP pyrophosphatase MutT (NUDIX family)